MSRRPAPRRTGYISPPCCRASPLRNLPAPALRESCGVARKNKTRRPSSVGVIRVGSPNENPRVFAYWIGNSVEMGGSSAEGGSAGEGAEVFADAGVGATAGRGADSPAHALPIAAESTRRADRFEIMPRKIPWPRFIRF
jgi:hypothetical protein